MRWSKGPVLVLAPVGRDARVATAILAEIGVRAETCETLDALVHGLGDAACAIITEEAFVGAVPEYEAE